MKDCDVILINEIEQRAKIFFFWVHPVTKQVVF